MALTLCPYKDGFDGRSAQDDEKDRRCCIPRCTKGAGKNSSRKMLMSKRLISVVPTAAIAIADTRIISRAQGAPDQGRSFNRDRPEKPVAYAGGVRAEHDRRSTDRGPCADGFDENLPADQAGCMACTNQGFARQHDARQKQMLAAFESFRQTWNQRAQEDGEKRAAKQKGAVTSSSTQVASATVGCGLAHTSGE